MDAAYVLAPGVPSVDEYRRLRAIAGLTPRSAAAAAAGLPNTIAGAVARKNGIAVGMGRAIGDGALCFHIVDMAVDPAHQGRGLGAAIMAALIARLREIAPAEADVSLIADGDAHRLYARFGFVATAPASIGMAMWLSGAERR